MDATIEQIEMLDKLQEIDRRRIRAEREIVQLPHRNQVIELRKQKADLLEKLDRVKEMQVREEKRISRIELEDQQLADKQRKTQEKIDSAKGDYRAVNTWTRDLQGMAKRRNTLDGDLSAAMEKLSQIEKIRNQAEGVIAKLETQERGIIESHRSESERLSDEIEKCKIAGKAIALKLPRNLLELYVDAVQRCGGVGLAHLNDSQCSACRGNIDQNRLLQVKREAPISKCPNCGRILIIELDE